MSESQPSESPTLGQIEIIAAEKDLAGGDVTFVANGIMTRVHSSSECAGEACWVHAPSQHHMATWPVQWQAEKRTAERVCSHGTGHPDPDDQDYQGRHGRDVSVHGCDGCCVVDPPGDDRAR